MVNEQNSKKRSPYLGEAGSLVKNRIEHLQKMYLQGKPGARRELAELRKAVHRNPGDVPAIWVQTSVSEQERFGSAPTPTEWAVHLALTLYGYHQQGRSVPMHNPDTPFSTAVRQLAAEASDESSPERSPVWRRFTAAMLADDIEGTREHLQSLIGQMHSAKKLISFDYSVFADDLARMQFPGGAARTRLKWQREFYKPTPKQSKKETNSKEESQ